MHHLRNCAEVESTWNKRIRKEQLILVCGRTLQLPDVKNKIKPTGHKYNFRI